MKDNSKASVSYNGVSFTGLLQLAFIVLKLTHVIDWSWWWVLTPIIFSVGFTILVIAIYIWAKS